MINRFHEAGYETVAIGDSYNDVSMLEGATNGILFRPAQKLAEEKRGILPIAQNYEELKIILEKII